MLSLNNSIGQKLLARPFFPILLILILALALRLPLLNGSFCLDEAAQALESARPLAQQLNILEDFQPPLLHLLLHFALKINDSEWWLRTIGVLIPGLITIAATYFVGLKLAQDLIASLSPKQKILKQKSALQAEKIGIFVGSISSLLLATSSFHIYFSQELRPYSLSAMLASLSWLVLLHWNKKRGAKNYRSYLLLTLLTALGLFSSFLYPFVIISQILYAQVFFNFSFKKSFSLFFLGMLLYTPWLPTFVDQLATGQLLRQQLPGWESVVSLPQIKALPLTVGKFLLGMVNLDPTAPVIASLLALALLGVVSWYFATKIDKKLHFAAVCRIAITFLFPLLTAWLISIFVPVVQPKRLIFFQPFLYIFISLEIAFLYFSDSLKRYRQLAKVSILSLLIINLFFLTAYWKTPALQREDWRSLYQEIQTSYPKDETVLVYSFPGAFAPMRWYDTVKYPTVATEKISVLFVPDLANQLKSINNYKYVLFFDYLTDLTDPDGKVINQIEDFGYHQVTEIDYPNIGFVRVFVKQADATALRPELTH